MKKWAILGCLALLLGSCNDEVFVEPVEVSATECTLDGNGDEQFIDVSSDDWQVSNVWYSSPALTDAVVVHYDAAGNPMDGDAQSRWQLEGIGRMEVRHPLAVFSIEHCADHRLRIAVEECFFFSGQELVVTVGNGYASQEIHAVLSPAERYRVEDVAYNFDNYSRWEETGKDIDRFYTVNSTDAPMEYHLTLDKREYSEVRFIGETDRLLAMVGEGVKVAVPEPEDDGLGLRMGDDQALLSSGWEPLTPRPEEAEVVTMEIPPRSLAIIDVKADHVYFKTELTLTATNPKSGRRRQEKGWVERWTPMRFTHTVEFVGL